MTDVDTINTWDALMKGADLNEWRRLRNLTQGELGLALDVSRQTVAQWEKSFEPLPRMLRLALIGLENSAASVPPVAGKRASVTDYRLVRKRRRDVGFS